MDSWLELSYAYIFACIQNKKKIDGAESFLHRDAIKPYQFIEAYAIRYHGWPSSAHYKKVFNIDARLYIKHSFSHAELSDLLRSHWAKDIAADTAMRLQQAQYEDDLSPQVLQDILQRSSDRLHLSATSSGMKLSQILTALKHYRTPDEKVAQFGFPMLDRYTGGIAKGQYTIIFGSVSEGKSTFARRLSANIALQGKKVLYLSLEEQEIDSIILTAAVTAGFNASPIFDNKIDVLSAIKSKKLAKVLQSCGGDVTFIDKVEHRGKIEQIQALVKIHEPDVIIVDQITLFTPGGSSEEKEVTKVTRMLKSYCQTSKIPIIALTQRMRAEKGAKKDNAHGDNIGYAASIYQDCDLLLYVHKTDNDGEVDRKKVTIAKNRKRRRFIEINYFWELDKGRIEEIEDYADSGEPP